VSLLRPGIVTVYTGNTQIKFVVLGGFIEVSPQGNVTVLAESASTVEDFDRAALHARITEMETSIKSMPQDSLLDKAIQRLDHFKQVNHHLQGTAMH
jgi:F-type H+-transporting ATPase subunit epsilon